jgi:predicted nucleic acid-binding protein
MSVKAFVDTNILIYAHDIDALAKHELAKQILQALWTQQTGVLSMQVLQEFYVNVTRKIASPLSQASARAIVNSYMVWCIETNPGGDLCGLPH